MQNCLEKKEKENIRQFNMSTFINNWRGHYCIAAPDSFLLNKMCSNQVLTPKVLVTTTDAQWEGMGDVGSERYEPALLPPCPTIRVLSYSN